MKNDEKKLFQEIFELARTDLVKFKRRLKQSNFSTDQKKILESFFFYQKRNKEEIFSRLRKKQMQDPYLEATRNYVLGLTFNHFGKYSFATEKLTLAIKQYESINEVESIFYPTLYLVLVYANQKDLENMLKYTHLMNKHSPKNEHQEMAMIHANIVSMVTSDQHEEAKVALAAALGSSNSYLEDYKSGLLILDFMLALKKQEYDHCHDVLIEYKKSKGFAVRPNYLYMRSLFEHLVKGSPLYIYENNFIECTELLEQLEVVKALSRGDHNRAQSFWKKLQKHNPSLYGDNYSFNGDFCLFSMALDKYAVTSELNLDAFINLSISPYEKLELIFKDEKTIISKEKLIEVLWQEEVSELTMARLRKLISRFNQGKSSRLVSHQDTYKRVS